MANQAFNWNRWDCLVAKLHYGAACLLRLIWRRCLGKRSVSKETTCLGKSRIECFIHSADLSELGTQSVHCNTVSLRSSSSTASGKQRVGDEDCLSMFGNTYPAVILYHDHCHDLVVRAQSGIIPRQIQFKCQLKYTKVKPHLFMACTMINKQSFGQSGEW